MLLQNAKVYYKMWKLLKNVTFFFQNASVHALIVLSWPEYFNTRIILNFEAIATNSLLY